MCFFAAVATVNLCRCEIEKSIVCGIVSFAPEMQCFCCAQPWNCEQAVRALLGWYVPRIIHIAHPCSAPPSCAKQCFVFFSFEFRTCGSMSTCRLNHRLDSFRILYSPQKWVPQIQRFCPPPPLCLVACCSHCCPFVFCPQYLEHICTPSFHVSNCDVV